MGRAGGAARATDNLEVLKPEGLKGKLVNWSDVANNKSLALMTGIRDS